MNRARGYAAALLVSALVSLVACTDNGKKTVADMTEPRVDGANGQFDLMADLIAADLTTLPDLAAPADLAGDDLTASPDLVEPDLAPRACTTPEECDDGVFCNGVEVCTDNVCGPGTAPVIADAVDCTDDFCDETNDQILHVPNDSLCIPSSLATFCIASGPFTGQVGKLARTCDQTTGCSAELTVALDDCTNRTLYPDVFSCGEGAILVDKVACAEASGAATCAAQTTTDTVCVASTAPSCTGSSGAGDLAWRHDYLAVCTDSGTPQCGETFTSDACTAPSGNQCSGNSVVTYEATCDAISGCFVSDPFEVESCNFDPTYVCIGNIIYEQTYGCVDASATCGVVSETQFLDCTNITFECRGPDLYQIGGCADGATTCSEAPTGDTCT